ncbi:MAG: HD-GYP domain-containing protein [Thermoleophilia bacterium]|nr:HD-GYP domain-containing protein [Thermoleophilia bacterium]
MSAQERPLADVLSRDGGDPLRADRLVGLLAQALELRDERTGLHSRRMSCLAGLIACKLGLGKECCDAIRLTSLLHDIGKLAVPDRILLKPGPLTKAQRAVVERHPLVGYELLAGSGSSLLDTAAVVALTHHERFDGGGYPRRLARFQIPLEGRIAAVADVFDALITDQPYRPRLSVDEAVATIRRGSGSRFDPEVIDAFLGSLDDALQVYADTGSAEARAACPAWHSALGGSDGEGGLQ